MKSHCHFIKILIAVSLCFEAFTASSQKNARKERLQLADEIERSMRTELLDKWYPKSVDSLYGGFLTTFSYKFEPTGEQDKMIVTQARHVWSNALASRLYPRVDHHKRSAAWGFSFLKDKMWDKANGGFYTLVDRKGNVRDRMIP